MTALLAMLAVILAMAVVAVAAGYAMLSHAVRQAAPALSARALREREWQLLRREWVRLAASQVLSARGRWRA